MGFITHIMIHFALPHGSDYVLKHNIPKLIITDITKKYNKKLQNITFYINATIYYCTKPSKKSTKHICFVLSMQTFTL